MAQESLEVKIGKLEILVRELHNRLLGGNGQLGVIQVHDEQIDKLQAWKNKAHGAIIVVSFGVTALGIVRIVEAFWK